MEKEKTIVLKKEKWKNQTFLDFARTNGQIAGEYFRLVMFVKDNFKQRYELIQNPILHLISHSIELFYKELLEEAVNCGLVDLNKKDFVHCHDLDYLCDNVIMVFKELSKNGDQQEEYILSQDMLLIHKRLSNLLKTDTTKYRYINHLDKDGNIKQISLNETTDSPNMKDVYDLYEDCISSTIWAESIISDYYSQI